MNLRVAGLALILAAGTAGTSQAQVPQAIAKAPSVPDSAVLTPAIIEQGRKVFHGQGNCYACHGNKLEGGPIAPALHGPKWKHIDGSYDAIIRRIDEGMPGTAMVSHPGGVSEAQVLMVATYIYAVSRGMTKP